jgi:hypothetical protein
MIQFKAVLQVLRLVFRQILLLVLELLLSLPGKPASIYQVCFGSE